MKQSQVIPKWSSKHRKVLYHVKVQGCSTALIFNADELAALRKHIDLALGGTDTNGTDR